MENKQWEQIKDIKAHCRKQYPDPEVRPSFDLLKGLRPEELDALHKICS